MGTPSLSTPTHPSGGQFQVLVAGKRQGAAGNAWRHVAAAGAAWRAAVMAAVMAAGRTLSAPQGPLCGVLQR